MRLAIEVLRLWRVAFCAQVLSLTDELNEARKQAQDARSERREGARAATAAGKHSVEDVSSLQAHLSLVHVSWQ